MRPAKDQKGRASIVKRFCRIGLAAPLLMALILSGCSGEDEQQEEVPTDDAPAVADDLQEDAEVGANGEVEETEEVEEEPPAAEVEYPDGYPAQWQDLNLPVITDVEVVGEYFEDTWLTRVVGVDPIADDVLDQFTADMAALGWESTPHPEGADAEFVLDDEGTEIYILVVDTQFGTPVFDLHKGVQEGDHVCFGPCSD